MMDTPRWISPWLTHFEVNYLVCLWLLACLLFTSRSKRTTYQNEVYPGAWTGFISVTPDQMLFSQTSDCWRRIQSLTKTITEKHFKMKTWTLWINQSVATAECDICAAQNAASSQLSVIHMILTHPGDNERLFLRGHSLKMAAAVAFPWHALG